MVLVGWQKEIIKSYPNDDYNLIIELQYWILKHPNVAVSLITTDFILIIDKITGNKIGFFVFENELLKLTNFLFYFLICEKTKTLVKKYYKQLLEIYIMILSKINYMIGLLLFKKTINFLSVLLS